MSNTEKDWKTDWAENLKPLGCLIAIICFVAVVAGLFAPLHSPKHRAEDLLKKGAAAFDAQDFEAAAKNFVLAAELGNAEAQSKLATCYYDGVGVKKDDAEAVKWFRKAAEQGNAEAQFHLAAYYCNGIVVERDLSEAVKWLRKAADQGMPQAEMMVDVLESAMQEQE